MQGSSDIVDLLKFLRSELHMSNRLARGLIQRGCVTIDGVVIRPCDNRRWTKRQLYGRLLHASGIEASVRMFTPSLVERG